MLSSSMQCSINDCLSTAKTKGFCGKHYARKLRYGDPLYQSNYGRGHKTKNGYIVLYRKGKLVFEHREIWELNNGPIPDGFVIHHKNHDPSDNCIANLQLMPRSNHIAHHQSKIMDGKKTCSRCRLLMPIGQFYLSTRRSGRFKGQKQYTSWCKPCHAEKTAKCKDCGVPINRNASRCRQHSHHQLYRDPVSL